jgi:hypothetical protein
MNNKHKSFVATVGGYVCNVIHVREVWSKYTSVCVWEVPVLCRTS